MKSVKTFVSAVLGGACIGFGGTAFLSLDSKVLGALFFTVGLFVICTFGLNLFTGKVCYVFQKDRAYAWNIPLIWLGNLVGTGVVAAMMQMTRNASIADKAAALCQVKLEDSLLSLFILGVLCNIFIYIGVEGFNHNPHELGKYLSLFFGVMVFILCGFEHCIADMFYFSMAGAWSSSAVVRLFVITMSNAVGGIIFPEARKLLI
jgi:formate transporter